LEEQDNKISILNLAKQPYRDMYNENNANDLYFYKSIIKDIKIELLLFEKEHYIIFVINNFLVFNE